MLATALEEVTHSNAVSHLAAMRICFDVVRAMNACPFPDATSAAIALALAAQFPFCVADPAAARSTS